LRHGQINVPAKECFEGIREIDKESTPGAKRLIAEIHYEIQIARFQAESSGGGRTENLQAFDVKLPAQLDNLFDRAGSDAFGLIIRIYASIQAGAP
jgi:hypothetical protein